MDNSLTNLMNESQTNTNNYKFQLDITDENRVKINKVLYFLGFTIQLFLFMTHSIIINLSLYFLSLFFISTSIFLIYKNTDYIINNLYLSAIYILSLLFQLLLITTTNNVIGLVVSILYQIGYIVNYE